MEFKRDEKSLAVGKECLTDFLYLKLSTLPLSDCLCFYCVEGILKFLFVMRREQILFFRSFSSSFFVMYTSLITIFFESMISLDSKLSTLHSQLINSLLWVFVYMPFRIIILTISLWIVLSHSMVILSWFFIYFSLVLAHLP